ncbi:hypothetical protein CRYUN_Cryun09bG0127800 [Craigia yunnanensis]
MAGEGALFKFLKPRLRPQPADIQSAALWGVAATTSALWLIHLSFFLLNSYYCITMRSIGKSL